MMLEKHLPACTPTWSLILSSGSVILTWSLFKWWGDWQSFHPFQLPSRRVLAYCFACCPIWNKKPGWPVSTCLTPISSNNPPDLFDMLRLTRAAWKGCFCSTSRQESPFRVIQSLVNIQYLSSGVGITAGKGEKSLFYFFSLLCRWVFPCRGCGWASFSYCQCRTHTPTPEYSLNVALLSLILGNQGERPQIWPKFSKSALP